MKASVRFTILVVVIFAIAFLRFALVDYANFAPIAAAGIFGLYFLRNKTWAIGIAISALFISDGLIHLQSQQGLYASRSLDYLSLVLALLFALVLLSKQKNFFTAIGSALGASLVFFVASNFFVWLTSTMYPHNWSGLASCFELAIPFYRGTLLGDVVFTAVFVGAVELIGYVAPNYSLSQV